MKNSSHRLAFWLFGAVLLAAPLASAQEAARPARFEPAKPSKSAASLKATSEPPAISVEVDAIALRKSGLINRLMFMMGEVNNVKQLLSTYQDVLGINPWEDLNGVRFEAQSVDFRQLSEDPRKALTGGLLAVRLAKPGNLEGMLLAAPRYSSQIVDGLRIHHCQIEESLGLYLAFLKEPRKSGVEVLIALDSAAIPRGVKARAAARSKAVSASPSDKTILLASATKTATKTPRRIGKVQVSAKAIDQLRKVLLAELGDDDDDEPPVSIMKNVAGLIQEAAIEANCVDQKTKLKLTVAVKGTDQVEQLKQFAAAGIGVLALMAREEPTVAQVVKQIRDGTTIKTSGRKVVIETSLDVLLSIAQFQ